MMHLRGRIHEAQVRRLGRALGAILLLATLTPLTPQSSAGAARSELHTLPFTAGAVDPLVDLDPGDPVDHDLILVQFRRFGEPGIVDAVASTGARMIQPLAPVSYLVWADAAQTQRIRRLPAVRWAGVLPPELRVAPSVDPTTTRLRVTLVERPRLAVGSLLRAGFADAELRSARGFTDTTGAIVELPGDTSVARLLAEVPTVYSVADGNDDPRLRDERSSQIAAGRVDKEGQPVGSYDRFLRNIEASGRGVVISHVDSGVDYTHPDLRDRVRACIDYSVAGGTLCQTRNTDDDSGHGTHTAGIIVGAGETNETDTDGFRYGLGVAPGARLVVQNAIGSASGGAFSRGYRKVYKDAHDKGAIVTANSWGPSGSPQGYDANTREFDTIPRDINDTRKGDQPMGFVLSVMNGRGGRSTQGTPDEGKNLIRVGGSGDRDPSVSPNPRRGPDDLCWCTAHGPALDGRMLPDIVAPGQNVMSPAAKNGVSCGYAGMIYGEPPSTRHAGCTGTSMASPHVSGAYAVFVDWYRQHHRERIHHRRTPSPALVKAAFINQAFDLSRRGGVDANGMPLRRIPNDQQGWGRLDLGATIRAWRRGVVHVDQGVVFTRSGQQRSIRVRPRNPNRPMRVTLVWTDAPGHGKGGQLPAWVNDLDLSVTRSGRTWRGNVFGNGWSKAGGRADRKNNVENVFLRRAGKGALRVRVRAANIIGDGLPNRPGRTDQDFALIISNARRAGR